MDYISVEQAVEKSGLRLVLTAGAPGPWGESAKAIFQLKGIDFTAVRQDAGGDNNALQQWTGQSSAPVAIYNDEAPRAQSIDILYLAERLGSQPSLIPADAEMRSEMFGLIREIIGEQGFAWNRRLLMFQPLMEVPAMAEMMAALAGKYGYSDQAAQQAPQCCVEILTLLAKQLHRQQAQGSRYFIGDRITALDIYWANFAAMLKPLPPEDNPMSEAMRTSYETLHPDIVQGLDTVLLDHRDFIYQTHLTLPLDF